jgi:hypothetical protein
MFLDNFDLGGVSRVRWIIKLRDKLERYLSVWGTNTARDFRLHDLGWMVHGRERSTGEINRKAGEGTIPAVCIDER